MLGWLKTIFVWGTPGNTIMALVTAAVIAAVTIHLRNDQVRAARLTTTLAQLKTTQDRNASLLAQNAALRIHILELNERIKRMNADKLRELEAHRGRIRQARQAAEDNRRALDTVTEALAEARRDHRAALETDEDFAEWAISPVPDAVWRILRQSADGTNATH